jgi:outer membrane protein OmpA-like peptidoglycan-associated protein
LTVERPDGSRVLTWRDESGALVRRVRVLPDGREIVLFDDSQTAPVRVTELPPIRRDEQRTYFLSRSQPEEIRTALAASAGRGNQRDLHLRQILANEQVRWLMPSLSLDEVTFETGSAELGRDQVGALGAMGRALAERIVENPGEVFLVEGHTDAVGSDIANLALSDRRAETVATLLTELYDVPPENLVTQGFGEADLKVPTMGPARENRRVDLRRLTPILQ